MHQAHDPTDPGMELRFDPGKPRVLGGASVERWGVAVGQRAG